MLDIKQLRLNANIIAEQLKKRGFNFDTDTFNGLEYRRKELQVATQNIQNKRNTYSKEIGILKRNKEDASDILTKVANLGDELTKIKTELQNIQQSIDDILLSTPNIIHKDVPYGNSENDNLEVKKVGKIRKFNFPVKDHVELGNIHNELDFDSASKISGTRFSLMSGNLAKLHRSLITFMLDIHTKNGYIETYVPYLVNSKSLLGTGQLPKFEQDLFKTYLHSEDSSEKPLYLIPTAEVPLTNIVRDTIVDAKYLPKKYVAHTPCFRSEAGAYGKDTKGLIRQHQFEKVELVQIVKKEDSYNVLEQLTRDAESVLIALNLPYRKVLLCSGDLGFSAAKTYDLEVWLPAQNTYREISSCSNFEDFQARRLHARWKNPKTKTTELLHTLNGSGLAVGRTLVAIMENYQQQDASITIPEVLQPYLNGMQSISSS